MKIEKKDLQTEEVRKVQDIQKEQEEESGEHSGIHGSLRRRGYDRCRRAFASVYGILYEQKRVGAGRKFAKFKDRK